MSETGTIDTLMLGYSSARNRICSNWVVCTFKYHYVRFIAQLAHQTP